MTDEQAIAERAAKATLEELAEAWVEAARNAENQVSDKFQSERDRECKKAEVAFRSHCAALRDEVETWKWAVGKKDQQIADQAAHIADLTAQLERLKTAAKEDIPVNDAELVRIRNHAELSGNGGDVKIWGKMLITMVDGIRNLRALAQATIDQPSKGG